MRRAAEHRAAIADAAGNWDEARSAHFYKGLEQARSAGICEEDKLPKKVPELISPGSAPVLPGSQLGVSQLGRRCGVIAVSRDVVHLVDSERNTRIVSVDLWKI